VPALVVVFWQASVSFAGVRETIQRACAHQQQEQSETTPGTGDNHEDTLRELN
jgi:hypothetical protein